MRTPSNLEDKGCIGQTDCYRWIYNSVISKAYDFGLKIGLTPYGEKILRFSVYNAIASYIKRGDKILDLCCGTGTLTVLLARLLYKECEIIGADLSEGQIIQAKKKNSYQNLKFLVMNANHLNFNNNSFDKVIISAALHEMDQKQRLNVLKEVYRILKSGGVFLIFDHHEPKKTLKRLLYNFYLGFSEMILSKSSEMQRSIIYELRESNFKILKQLTVRKFLDFFQIIISTVIKRGLHEKKS